jgi:ABC-type amino acid transport system permease subunit
MLDLDFEIIGRTWKYLFFDGMAFTIELTMLAMVGGIVVGTLLALARLSSFTPVSALAGGCQSDPFDSARPGDLLVLLSGAIYWGMAHRVEIRLKSAPLLPRW